MPLSKTFYKHFFFLKQMKISKIVWFYCILVAVKIILISLVPSPSIYADEYLYSKIAKDIMQRGSYSIEGISTNAYPPLYPLLIAPAYLFHNMQTIYFFIKFINAFLSSLIIFPLYWLAKEFLEEKQAHFLTIIIAVMSSYFVTSSYIMAENIFYPLVTFTLYYIYKSCVTLERKYALYAGITIALAFLTKVIGIALIPLFLISVFIAPKNFKNIIVHYLTAGILVLPWIIRNIFIYGFRFSSLIGGGAGGATEKALGVSSNFLIFLNWFFLHIGYFILASGVIFALYLLVPSENKNLNILRRITLIALFFFLVLATNHTSINRIDYPSPFKLFTYRPVGRYLDAILPVSVLTGMLAFRGHKKPAKEINYLSLFIILLATQLVIAPLFPFNNQSLTFVGVTKYIVDLIFYGGMQSIFHWGSFVAMMIILLGFACTMITIKNKKVVTALFITLIIINTLFSFGITAWNAKQNWYDTNQEKIGVFLNNYDPQVSNIMIDKDEEGPIAKGIIPFLYEQHSEFFVAPAGFWLNDNLYIDSVDHAAQYDYVISKKELNQVKVAQEGVIKLYKVTK